MRTDHGGVWLDLFDPLHRHGLVAPRLGVLGQPRPGVANLHGFGVQDACVREFVCVFVCVCLYVCLQYPSPKELDGEEAMHEQ